MCSKTGKTKDLKIIIIELARRSNSSTKQRTEQLVAGSIAPTGGMRFSRPITRRILKSFSAKCTCLCTTTTDEIEFWTDSKDIEPRRASGKKFHIFL